jgi:hypothetical protein
MTWIEQLLLFIDKVLTRGLWFGYAPTAQPAPPTPPSPTDHTCPAGQHWDAVLGKCVPDTAPPPPPPSPSGAATASDPALVSQNDQGLVFVKAWNTPVRFGSKFQASGLKQFPQGDMYFTPVGGYKYNAHGCVIECLLRASKSGPHAFRFEGRGSFDFEFAGETVIEDTYLGEHKKDAAGNDYIDRRTVEVTRTLEAGKFYALHIGLSTGAPDCVTSLNLSMKGPDDADFHILPASATFPPVDQPAPPAQPPQPPNPDELPQPDLTQRRSPEFPPDFKFFPADYAWYQSVASAPIDPNSDAIIAGLRAAGVPMRLHPEVGAGASGFPINQLDSATPLVDVAFDTADESDRIKYSIPAAPALEPGGDMHYIGVDLANGRIYEIDELRKEGGQWKGLSGVVWTIGKTPNRPAGYTSADASGGPMIQGLIRPEEVFRDKRINHALRVTVSIARICARYVPPANHLVHDAGPLDGTGVPMGCRFRLKKNPAVDALIGTMPPEAQVIARAMQEFGMFAVDGTNSREMFFSGAQDNRWDDAVLGTLKQLTSDMLEVIKMPALMSKASKVSSVRRKVKVGLGQVMKMAKA